MERGGWQLYTAHSSRNQPIHGIYYIWKYLLTLSATSAFQNPDAVICSIPIVTVKISRQFSIIDSYTCPTRTAPELEIFHKNEPWSPNYTWNVTSNTRTQASAPAQINLPFLPSPSSQNTVFTPPGTAFLIAIFLIGFGTLHT